MKITELIRYRISFFCAKNLFILLLVLEYIYIQKWGN